MTNTAAVETSNIKKSTTLELTLNPQYVRTWGVWEAIRELVQNAMDSNENGFRMEVERGGGASKTIYIRNIGTTLSRSTLLLGSTSKEGSSARGKFGEGYKLALLVLCRNNIDVQVRTGSEMWTPFIERSETFDEQLLKVRVRPASKFENKVEVQVHGVSDNDWREIQSRLLNVPGLPETMLSETDSVVVGDNRILKGAQFQGLLFSRGIFVQKLPDAYMYGYDLARVELDRDRKAPDQYSLRVELTRLLREAIEGGRLTGREVYDLVEADLGEASVVESAYRYAYQGDALTKAIATEFETVNGANAVPVMNIAESQEASHYALRGVVVSAGVRVAVERERGAFETRKATKDLDVRKQHAFSDLTLEERDTLSWAARLVHSVRHEYTLAVTQVVDFYGEKILGTWHEKDGVRVSRKVLSNRKEALATIVHEVAHMVTNGAKDGSIEHRAAIEDIFAGIIVTLAL